MTYSPLSVNSIEEELTVHEVVSEEIDEDTGKSLLKIEETYYFDEDK